MRRVGPVLGRTDLRKRRQLRSDGRMTADPATYTRADLVGLLGISARKVSCGIKHLNDRGLFVETGEILANGKPEKRYRYDDRSEEHTSELQSHHDLVCR